MNRLKQFVTRLRRPDTREVAVAQVSDKYSEYPSNGLTPVKLAEIFREADAGDVLRQMELFEEMEEKDPHLFSQLQTRKNAVTGLDFEVIPFGDEPLDKEIADFIEEQLNGIESFEDVENDLLDAIGKGFAVSEILWGYDEGHVVVQDIKTRHQKRFFWDTLDDSFKVRTKDAPEGILLPANKFIVHKYKARSGHTSRAGILRVVAWMYLFKNYDLKDWASFAEIYGLPLRLGKYAPGASDSDKAALMQALIQIGSDAAGIIPDGTSIDFITTEKTSSSDLYERLARYCDEQISKAILGQTLTSDSGGGSYAQSKTHNDVRHDLTVADCKALASTLRRDLMQDKVNNIRGMALESQEEFDAALGDGSKADTARKAFIKLRGELTHLYQMQCSLRTAAQSDSEIALVDDLLADLEKISRKAHEQTHFTYTTLEEIAALN